MYHLIVIGGGPAGTAAAITAARRGARTLLLERGSFPRHKVCGEFVSAESLDLLAELLVPRFASLLRDALRIAAARLFLDGRILCTPIDPPAASIARLDLDAALFESAVASGVEARPQMIVQSVSGTGPFQIVVSGEKLASRAVIDATGRWSNLNSTRPDGRKSRQKWLGIKAHFAEPAPAPSVDLYFFDGGYCGVQPVQVSGKGPHLQRVNACAMVRADVATSLPEIFALHPVLAARSRAWQPLSDPVATSPLVFHQPQPVHQGVLMAGDAAAFVDPFVGDGISLALRSGSLAAECLIPCMQRAITLNTAASLYSQAYEARFASVLRTSSRIRRMLRLPRPLRTPILSLLQNRPEITRYMVGKTR
ncbi:MAG TPA: FAD-dependent oxidoreductase [Terriglobales bacterium]